MHRLPLFLLRKKSISLLRWPQIGKFFLLFFSAIFLGIAYGSGLSYLIDSWVETSIFTVHECMMYYTGFFGLFFLILDIFPSLKLSSFRFPSYYPISLAEKIAINITFSFLRHIILFVAIIQSILFIASEYVQAVNILSSSVILLGFYMMNRILKNSLEFTLKNPLMLNAFGLTFLCFSLVTYWIYGNSLVGFYSILFIVSLVIYVYFLSEVGKETKFKYSNNRYKKRGIFFQILYNKNVKVLIGLAFTIKILLMILAGTFYIWKGGYLFGFEIVTFMVASPLILFTYLGYNFFGINKNLFLTHGIRESSTSNLFIVYIKFFLTILSIDAAMYFIFIISTGLHSMENIVFYFSSSLLFLATAFPLSLRTPVIKERYFSFDFAKHGNKIISLPATAIAFFIILLIYMIKSSVYFSFIALFIVLFGVLLSWLLSQDMDFVVQKFYLKYKINDS